MTEDADMWPHLASLYKTLAQQARGVRMSGSAATNLCRVASGESGWHDYTLQSNPAGSKHARKPVPQLPTDMSNSHSGLYKIQSSELNIYDKSLVPTAVNAQESATNLK